MTLLIWTKCAALCSLCWKPYRAEWLDWSDNRCFFSTVAILLSSSWVEYFSSKSRAAHRPGFIRTYVYLRNIICQAVIKHYFRQIYKSLLEPTFWGLLQNVSRQMPFPSITIHLQVLNKWVHLFIPPAAALKLWTSACMLYIHWSGQIVFIMTAFLWKASDSSSGESQHFQTRSKPKGLCQACSSYLLCFSTAEQFTWPSKFSQYLCKRVH